MFCLLILGSQGMHKRSNVCLECHVCHFGQMHECKRRLCELHDVVGMCVTGAPVVVSFPHFHLGDKKYADAIDGISPVHEHHQTFLDLNPVSDSS